MPIKLSRFGQVFDEIRQRRGHTLDDVAAKIGLGATVVKRSRQYPLLRTLTERSIQALSGYVGCDPDDVRASVGVSGVEPMDVGAVDVEGWLDAQGGAFEISYRYLRSRFSLRPKPAFVGAWMSLHTDDRGGLATWGEVAGFLGVARQTVYGWRGVHRLDDHAELLRLARLRGDQLGEVDRVTDYQAVGEDMMAYPIMTASGVQYQEPVRRWQVACKRCDVYARCCKLVRFGNGFALCERLIPVDVLPGMVRMVVAENERALMEVGG